MERRGCAVRENVEELQERYTHFPVTVEEGTHGRGLVAARNIREGEMVLYGFPYAASVSEAQRESVCQYCLEDIDRQFVCKRCESTYYCSKKCREMDSRVHWADECAILCQWKPVVNETYSESVIEEMRLMVRVLARKTAERVNDARKEQEKETKQSDEKVEELDSDTDDDAQVIELSDEEKGEDDSEEYPSHAWLRSWDGRHCYEQYKSLEARPSDFDEATLTAIQYYMVKYILELRKWLHRDETESELVEIICRNRRNAFCYGNGSHEEPQASGVFILPALFNHSCRPNVMLRTTEGFKSGPVLVFLAAYDLEKGTPLTISYLDNGMLHMRDEEEFVEDPDDPYQSFAKRRAELHDAYRFWCNCEWCTEQERATVHHPSTGKEQCSNENREAKTQIIPDRTERSGADAPATDADAISCIEEGDSQDTPDAKEEEMTVTLQEGVAASDDEEEARLLAELEAIEREAQRKKEEILAKLAKAREKQ